MKKKELKAIFDSFVSKRSEAVAKIDKAATKEELDAVEIDIRKLDMQIAQAKADYEAAPEDDDPAKRSEEPAPEQRSFSPLAAGLGAPAAKSEERDDVYGSMEYRKAYKNYITNGTPFPAELRQAATTTTSDVGAVIPTTIMNTIIQKMRAFGMIYDKVRKTSFKGGVEYPTSAVKPTATWVADGEVSEKQKKTLGKISFSYHKLQCRVAITDIADTVSLEIFEETVAQDVYEAMIVAIEKAILNGTGSGQPKGIFKETAATTVDVKASELPFYATWAKIYSKLSKSYKARAVWLLPQSDWDINVVGAVDSNGQPIGRVTLGVDGVPSERLLGKNAVLVDDDYIAPSSTATTGSYIGALIDLSAYALNSNLNITMKRYFNDETDEWVTKATMICDGKMVDTNGVVLIKLKAE